MVDDPNIKKLPLLPPGGVKQIPPLKRPLPPSGLKVPALPPKGLGRPGEGVSGTGGMGIPRPPAPSLPAMSGSSAPSQQALIKDFEERLKKMEENAREAEEAKRKLERALAEMEIKLKEEKEKALAQAIKAREEESLSLKMEQALKEMQEKARRDRKEQELEEARLRAEEKVKELERRLNEEREAWVINLKKQMEMRDADTRQVEVQMESRFRDLEQRWLEEKSMLTQALKSKEDEIAQLKAQLPDFQAQAKRAQEDALHSVELTKKKIEQELEAKEAEFQREKRALSEKLELRERELVTLKAQLAMIDAQVKAAQDASQRSLQEKERTWQLQFSELQRDLFAMRQEKERMQAEAIRDHTENVALRREINEWEKKQNIWEQAVRDLKRKIEEYESLERNHRTEKQNWVTKLEERVSVERNLRDALEQKEQEIARLKMELQSLESRLEKKFEKERNEFLLMMERQVQEEVTVKTELAIKELGEIREVVMNELAELEKNVQAQQSMLAQKESELLGALEKIKSLEERLHEQKGFYESKIKMLEQEFLQEKQQQFARFSQKLKEEQEKMMQEQAKLSKTIAEKDAKIQSLEKQMQEERDARAQEKMAVTPLSSVSPTALPLPEKNLLSDKGFWGKVWKYLTRTVIVVNLKAVPRIQKKEGRE